MTISLVTGGAGFIGSHVVDELIKMGHRVVVLDDLSGGKRSNVHPTAEFVEGSVLDHELVESLFRRFSIDYVFHLAAYAAEGLSHFIRRFNYSNNLIGSVNVINSAVNSGSVKCFVFTSSIAVYGANQVPMNENLVPSPEDPYGIAKFAVERDLQQAHEMFRLPYIVFRPHNVYGERQNLGDRYRNVVGIFMNQAMRRQPFTVFGDGNQTRAFSYIDDVAPAIARSCERPAAYQHVYNIGGSVPCTVNELAEVVAEAMGVELEVQRLESRKEVVHAYCSHDRVCEVFGDLMEDVPLAAGISRMADWAKRVGPQEPTVFEGIEVAKNLPASWSEVVTLQKKGMLQRHSQVEAGRECGEVKAPHGGRNFAA